MASQDRTSPVDRIAAIGAENAERSRREVSAFIADKPDRYFAYLPGTVARGALVTTWTGDTLGRVQRVNREWHSNFGDRRVSFTMIGVNLQAYSGVAYVDSGDYVRLRKVA